MMKLSIYSFDSAEVVHMPQKITLQNASSVAKWGAELINE